MLHSLLSLQTNKPQGIATQTTFHPAGKRRLRATFPAPADIIVFSGCQGNVHTHRGQDCPESPPMEWWDIHWTNLQRQRQTDRHTQPTEVSLKTSFTLPSLQIAEGRVKQGIHQANDPLTAAGFSLPGVCVSLSLEAFWCPALKN